MTSSSAAVKAPPPVDIAAQLSGHLLIGGKWVESAERFTVLDKFHRHPVAEVFEATSEQVRDGVNAAAAAFDKGAPPPRERAALLRRVGVLLDEARPLLMPTLISEAGLTVAEARAEIDRTIATLDISAEEALRINGELVPFGGTAGQENRIGFTVRFPLGVVCAITPFNSPLNTVVHKVAPAYAAGNAVVLKPSALTPLSSEILCRAFVEAGAPPGFITLLQGGGGSIGNQLLENQTISFYAFTGSTRVGKLIAKAAGLRRTQLELGSIASTIICADADLERATTKACNAGFRKAGQVCTSVQLLLVERSAVGAVTALMQEGVKRIRTGDPHDPSTSMGPLIAESEAERVEGWIKDAEKEGADILCGGGRDGSVVQPTLLTNVRRGMRVVDSEVFGPLISIVPFDTLDEAIDLANASPYGLAAGLFTKDLSRGLNAARRLRFGGVHINEASSARADAMPFGGVKDSGFGREGPRYAIAEMSEERLITLNP